MGRSQRVGDTQRLHSWEVEALPACPSPEDDDSGHALESEKATVYRDVISVKVVARLSFALRVPGGGWEDQEPENTVVCPAWTVA